MTMDNMYWRPTVKIPDGVKLSYSLKEVFRRKFRRIQRNDGFKIVLNRAHSNDVTYLQALIDARAEGAQELLDALKGHESIDIWLDI